MTVEQIAALSQAPFIIILIYIIIRQQAQNEMLLRRMGEIQSNHVKTVSELVMNFVEKLEQIISKQVK
jgi:hypothetical protein